MITEPRRSPSIPRRVARTGRALPAGGGDSAASVPALALALGRHRRRSRWAPAARRTFHGVADQTGGPQRPARPPLRCVDVPLALLRPRRRDLEGLVAQGDGWRFAEGDGLPDVVLGPRALSVLHSKAAAVAEDKDFAMAERLFIGFLLDHANLTTNDRALVLSAAATR